MQDFLLINVPLVILSLTANIFYAWCLVFPPCNRRRIKQPLKTLLGLLVCFSIIYFVSVVVMYGVLKQQRRYDVLIVLWMMFLSNVYNSMTCSVWLNFYYYVQIVPSQRALLIWVKRNIRSFIYVFLFLDGSFFLFSSALIAADVVAQTSRRLNEINGTWTGYHIDELHIASNVCVYIVKLYIFGCLCIMMFSSFSTVHYLHGHIRSVVQGGSCFSTPRIQSQMRVTITGVSQGVLYLLYSIFYFFDSFTYILSSHIKVSLGISLTATSLYVLGTTVTLGIGQTTFRRRAAEVLKALINNKSTKDVKMHNS